MITFVRAYLHRRAQRQAESKALRDAEHAAAIQHEHARAYGDLCASLNISADYPSLSSRELAREIEEVRSGKVAPITRKRVRVHPTK